MWTDQQSPFHSFIATLSLRGARFAYIALGIGINVIPLIWVLLV